MSTMDMAHITTHRPRLSVPQTHERPEIATKRDRCWVSKLVGSSLYVCDIFLLYNHPLLD